MNFELKNAYIILLIIVLICLGGKLIHTKFFDKEETTPITYTETANIQDLQQAAVPQKTTEEQLLELNKKNEKEQEQTRKDLLKSLPETNIEDNTRLLTEIKSDDEKSSKTNLNFFQKLFGKSKNAAISVSTSDRDMLARIITAEAEDQPYEGQVAVGAVVLNRVKSGKFPDTIKGVIFAQGQFEPVSNGRYDRVKPSSTQYKAADEALSGSDPSNGALYFYAPTLTQTRWHETLTLTAEIGGHRFFK